MGRGRELGRELVRKGESRCLLELTEGLRRKWYLEIVCVCVRKLGRLKGYGKVERVCVKGRNYMVT